MKFKVWDDIRKKFLEPGFFFFLSEKGELWNFNNQSGEMKKAEKLSFYPVYSINEKDIYGVELSVGDKCKVWRYDSDCTQEVEILENGIITGDFGEYSRWIVKFAMTADYQFEKIGSKYET
jgi:hypothetical protein